MLKKSISIVVISILVLTLVFPILCIVKADTIKLVVSLGADLTKKQQDQILKFMEVERDEISIIETTIEEEAKYLKNTPAIKHIGNKTISSALVERLDKNEGISVKTHNITWVSEEMYENALITAGVKDARVIAAAPFEVSGTGALTGIMKAFEEITGEKLDEEAKHIASEEMVITGELGEDLDDQDKASELVNKVKEKIIEEGIKSPEDIKRIIIEIQHELNIKLSDKQIEKLTELMNKIKNIDINVDDLKKQVSKLGEKAKEIAEDNKEIKSFLQRITDFLSQIIKKIIDLF
jgi:uncharacterized protein YpuA (DUF1002 family)